MKYIPPGKIFFRVVKFFEVTYLIMYLKISHYAIFAVFSVAWSGDVPPFNLRLLTILICDNYNDVDKPAT